MFPSQIIFLTFTASGLGLAVAKSLAAKAWNVMIVDMNEAGGQATATDLNGTFYKTDVTDYKSLSLAFDRTFQQFQRIDFVFANAGIVERDNFYAKHDKKSPPDAPNMLSLDINLRAVMMTAYLAQHYMRQNPDSTGGCLISTSSVGGIYPSPFCPIYSGAKHGVIGFTRSIAKHYYMHDKIRVNAIMPGTMRTGLLSEQEWEHFRDQQWTKVEDVVNVVEMLLDDEGNHWGKCVEVSGEGYFFRDGIPYSTEGMRRNMEKTDVEALDDGDSAVSADKSTDAQKSVDVSYIEVCNLVR